MTVYLQRTEGSLRYTFDWEDDVPSGVTLESVEHTVPSPLTRVDQTTDSVAKTSSVQIAGGAHGGVYLIRALATLSNGERVDGETALRVADL